jgi:DNA-binding MurR/RpiR family transcriptional regulator
VARFCQSLDFGGYRDFRLAVASALSAERAQRDRFELVDGEIDPTDAAENVVAKIAYQETLAIEQTARALDYAALEGAVAAIAAAPRVDVYGSGASGLTASDLQQKLFRIGMVATYSADAHLALVAAALQQPGNVAIAISHSGLTTETVQALRVAHEAGATTVALTNFPDSALAEYSDFVLSTQARENRYRSGAMSSRIAQLALVDFVFVRVAQKRYSVTAEPLRRTYEDVRTRRLDAR